MSCLANKADDVYPYYDKASNRIITVASDGVVTLHQDATTLVKTVDERLTKALDKAAPVLKVGAEHVWDTLVKQQKVWAYMWTFLLCCNLYLWYKWRKYVKLSNGEDSYVALAIVLGGICLTGSIFIMQNWNTIWTGLFNPDYGAMTQLAEFAKSLK